MELISVIAIITLVVLICLQVYVALDIPKRKFKTERERKKWLNILFFLPVIGVFMYLLRSKK